MSEEREGFVFHVLSKLDKESGLHIFNRVKKPDPDEGTLGKLIRYESDVPLGVWIPVDFPVQQEYVKDFSTKIGGKNLTSIEACLGRFIVHKSESIWADFKSNCPDGEVFDDADRIRKTCEEWDGQSNGKRGKKVVEASKSKLKSLTEAEKVEYLMEQGMIFTD